MKKSKAAKIRKAEFDGLDGWEIQIRGGGEMPIVLKQNDGTPSGPRASKAECKQLKDAIEFWAMAVADSSVQGDHEGAARREQYLDMAYGMWERGGCRRFGRPM